MGTTTCRFFHCFKSCCTNQNDVFMKWVETLPETLMANGLIKKNIFEQRHHMLFSAKHCSNDCVYYDC